MFCDEMKELDAFQWDGLDKNGQKLIKAYMDMLPSIHKFYLTQDFAEFSNLPPKEFPGYVEKIKPLVRLPYAPMLIETKINGFRSVVILDNGDDGELIAINFNEIMYEDEIMPQCFIAHFWPDTFSPDGEGGFSMKVDFILSSFAPTIDHKIELGRVSARLMDVLARINSPNITEMSGKTDLSKLNKSRAKRGKSPLSDYHIVSLTHALRLAMNNMENGETEGKRLHWVRGHMKIRKTGMFWWNPHTAGRPELGEIKKDYVKDVVH